MTRMRYTGFSLMLVAAVLFSAAPLAAGSQEEHRAEADHDQERIWIGIYMHGGSDRRDGVHVLSVMDDSPADEADLRAGDVILSVDGREVRTVDEFSEALEGLRPGDRVKVVVLRDGDERQLLVTLGRPPAKQHYATRFRFPKMQELQDFARAQARARGYLGVELQGMSGQLREYFGAPGEAGVLVSEVRDDSPAAAAGLKAGDVIVEADGVAIAEARDLTHLMRDKKEGDPVAIVFLRDRAERRVEAISGVTEHEVWDVGPLVWCDDDKQDCSVSYSFDFGDGQFAPAPLLEGLEHLHEYLNSPDVRSKLEQYYEQSERFEDELRRKNRELERKLEELERRLEEIQERRDPSSGI